MVINWSENAINDLKEYKRNSQIYTQNKLNNYIISLTNYIDNLYVSPRLGKLLFIHKYFEYRQLIYEMHRIFYSIHNNEIYILTIVHISHNIEDTIEYLSTLFYK